MKHNRFSHQVDVFCEMFSGWKLIDDIKTLEKLKEGQLEMDFIENKIKFNNEPYLNNINVFNEILYWFEKDLNDNNFDKKLLLKANLIVDFTAIKGNNLRNKNAVEIYLKMKSRIQTEKKEYESIKEYNELFSLP